MAAFASPFAKELCTNYVPSPRDRDLITGLLVEPQKRLAQLDSKIFELEKVLETLKQERNTLDDEIQKHNHLLSPIRRLPDDMLREIFLACLPDTHNATMSCAEVPLLLGLVCSRWRHLAYSTPRLWATLHIALPSNYPYRPARGPGTAQLFELWDGRIKKHCAALLNWLTRSGSCPLSISFHLPLHVSHQNLGFQPYIDIVLSHSHRWYDLEMSIPCSSELSDTMTSIPATSLPILTHLHLIFTPGTTKPSKEEKEKWESSALLNTPKLRTLNASFIPVSPSHLAGNSWSHLSSLTLTHAHYRPPHTSIFATVQEAYNILRRCSRLTHCALDIFGGDISIPVDIISLPYLKTFSITESYSSISTLFECFSEFPKLRGISYRTNQVATYARASPLITLLARANQVTHLATDFNAATLADLSTIFALVPNLTHLIDESSRVSTTRINHLPKSFNVERAVLDLLTSFIDTEIYCPRLESLQITRQSQLRDADILSFLRNRRCVEPLRKFSARFSRAMEVDIRTELLDCIEDGSLKLDLVYRPRQSRHKPQFDPRNGLLATQADFDIYSTISHTD